jgi:hypothetical protein
VNSGLCDRIGEMDRTVEVADLLVSDSDRFAAIY